MKNNKLKEATQSLLESIEKELKESQAYYDNKSETWQDSEKGCEYERWIYSLEESYELMQDVLINLS